MTVEIGGVVYDDIAYLPDGDVLYLWSGKPRKPAYDDASPEGHYLQFAEDGTLIAVTIVNARWLLETEGRLTITLPDGRQLDASGAVGPVVAAA